VLPGMRDRGHGRIVNLASVAGRSISQISNLHYSTAKAAILGFTRKLAYEEAGNGITVNSIAPGTVFTERVETRFRAQSEAVQTTRMSEIPMGRAARPEEIAAAILFLASEDASYVTGAALDVNGGRFMS
jgi:3-oxoacyl-[acyl-carrier protein] reductase